MKNVMKVGLGVLLLLLGGCASTTQDKQVAQTNRFVDPRDPLEQYNRPLFEFNWKVLDANILRPAAQGYAAVVPAPVRGSLANAVENLDEPVSFVNNLLQFKLKDAAVTTGRFLINSTIGLLGLFDVASEIGLKPKEEDFAQTLGKWGVEQGPFLMLPAMGPSTAKDLSGQVVDWTALSFDVLTFPQSLLKFTIKTLDTRVELMDQEQLLNDSLDPYSFTKEAYLQRQEYKLYDGNVPVKEDDYGDLSQFDESVEESSGNDEGQPR